MQEKKLRILLSGSQGFIGHNFCKYLTSKGHGVIGVDIRDEGYPQMWYNWDLRKEVPEVGADIVFHLASDVGGINYISGENKGQMIENNIKMDLNVIDYCKRNKLKLVYFSSSCVYDGNLYGQEKLFAEMLIEHSGIDYLIVRPQNVYGLGDKKKGDREQVIMALFRKAQGEYVDLMGSGKEKRSFIWTEDLFNLIMKHLKIKKSHVIDAGGEWISIRELAEKIIKIEGKKIPIKTGKYKEKPKKKIEFKKARVSIDKRLREIWKEKECQ